ncbi:gamma-tubulin complex component 4 isoform X1 [Parasteatoda tepidariorum]|uniref:gamma-tubulin complex component 4 isoform X1 n=1 Tax=Parasteatoda tepidariorum TaxID=114398 RepID=UPI001C72225F|nr:gamma-tubulin complex component 4 isoform X1 [Parasteatoda tepidariorum]XP_015928418.2 gamma-tubulin complex component 4 isoform X1 [Parasteatoda tepidariorum]XP_042903291.1 gamma-tubulin complex component 4 isoform X1 [Parasteatoda tepidariorum]XP_042903292.1 gamma-tubulin complex component 4 isoform X1 [Parasteatoda tepidariorum]
MFHELLMALSGFPGTIFYHSSKEQNITVSSCVPNLHPGERNILDRLCLIATKYRRLHDFGKVHKFSADLSGDPYEVKGLYLKSFCCGLETVLNMYQQELVEIEQELLKDPFLPLTHFLKLEKWDPLFEVLCSIVKEIQDEQKMTHGCRILELLFKHSVSGVPLIEVAINKILQSCHSVMYRQVFSLMMNGSVEDPFREFFIQQDTSAKRPQGNSNFASDKDNVKYIIEPTLLPSYIPSNLAAKVQFVGEYVSILGATENSDSYSLFLKKERVFAKKFEKLIEKPSFSLLNFETTVDDIRKCASEYLWDVIVKQCNVKNHFKILKDFYLLGNGELFLNFICEANQLLRMPMTLSAETDASKLFTSVVRRIYPDDELITEKFRIEFQEKRKNIEDIDKGTLSKAKLETGWSAISLHYDVLSPLHILFTPNVIDQYNMVFRFLLSLRRAQMELHQCWASQMQNKRNCLDSSLIPFWTLRSHMSFLIDNFQYYVLVDVLESRFCKLISKMENVKDYEELQQSHEQFLTDVISRCFLELKTVHLSLNEILELCSSFCNLMSRLSSTRSQKEIAQFENLKLVCILLFYVNCVVYICRGTNTFFFFSFFALNITGSAEF